MQVPSPNLKSEFWCQAYMCVANSHLNENHKNEKQPMSKNPILLNQNHLSMLTSSPFKGTLRFEHHGLKTLLCYLSPRQKP